MQLYFSPLACSLATRIALYEAGAEATFIEVDAKTKLTRDGAAYRDVHPLGLVPALRTPEGRLLTENAAILQYVADRHPQAGLLPAAGFERSLLQQWLSFISSELHKALFVPLLDPNASAAIKSYALDKQRSRLDHLERYLQGREYLGDRFSVADAYLVTVLNWTAVTEVKLADWPTLQSYHARLRERASVARAAREELALYQRAQAAQARP